MATIGSTYFRVLLAKGIPNFSFDTVKLCLMKEGYVFDPALHKYYSQIAGSEIETGYGYTTGGYELRGVQIVQDNIAGRAVVTYNNASISAVGGDIGPSIGAILYASSLPDPETGAIIGFIDFYGSILVSDGGVGTVGRISISI